MAMIIVKHLPLALLVLGVCGQAPSRRQAAPAAAEWSTIHPFGRDVLARADRAAPDVRQLWPELWTAQPRLLIHLRTADQTLLLDAEAPDSSFLPVTGDSVPAGLRGRLFLHDGPPPAEPDLFSGKRVTRAQMQLSNIKHLELDAGGWDGAGRAAAVHDGLRLLYGTLFEPPWSRETVFPRGGLNGVACISAAESCHQTARELEQRLLSRAMNAPQSELPVRLREYASVAWLRAINSLPWGGDTFRVRYYGTRGAIAERAARLASQADTAGYASLLVRRTSRKDDENRPGQLPAAEATGEAIALLLDRLEYDWKAEVRRDSGSFLTAIARATDLEWTRAPAIAWRAAEEADLPRLFAEERYSGPPGEWIAASLALYTTTDSTPVKILLPPRWREDTRYELQYSGIGGDSLAVPGAVLFPRSVVHVRTPWLDLHSRGYPATVVESPGNATGFLEVQLFLPADLQAALMASVAKRPCGDPFTGPGVRATTGPGARINRWGNAREITGDPDDTRECVRPGVPARAPLITTTTFQFAGAGAHGPTREFSIALCGNPMGVSIAVPEATRETPGSSAGPGAAGGDLAAVQIVNAETGSTVWQGSLARAGVVRAEVLDVPQGRYRVIGRGTASTIRIQIRDTRTVLGLDSLEGCDAPPAQGT